MNYLHILLIITNIIYLHGGKTRLAMEHINIEQLYNRLKPHLVSLEEDRLVIQKKLAALLKWVLTGLAVLAVPVILMFSIGVSLLLVVPAFFIYIIMRQRYIKKYRADYKDGILLEMVKALGNEFNFDAAGKIDPATLQESGLFEYFFKSVSEDLISGQLAKYSFRQAEVRLSASASSNDGSSRTIFSGLFIDCTLPFSFPQNIWIYSKNEMRKSFTKGRQVVETGDPGFDNEFVTVVNTDRVPADILPPPVIAAIQEIYHNLPDKMLKLSFVNNRVFIAIYILKDLFEPPLNTPITDFNRFKEDFQYLQFTTSLVNRLFSMQ